MTLWLGDNTVKVWKIEDKGKYTQVQFSSSRKVEGEYVNSSWAFTRFVGKAHEMAKNGLHEGDRITLKKSYLAKEPYKDSETGETKYPQNPQLVVFEWEIALSNGGGKKQETSIPVLPDDEDVPF